jgi:hypothetical protein
MDSQEIEDILIDSGEPCISVIIPTHRLSPDRRQDFGNVNDAVEKAIKLIKIKYENSDYPIGTLEFLLNKLLETIDFTHLKEGLGIYVSLRIQKIIKFPFQVIEKIKAAETFDSRDLLYYKTRVIKYHLLSISQKHIHLFNGEGEKLKEIHNDDFPLNYEETYEYSKPSRGNSFGSGELKEFERDKSILEEVRVVDFLKHADHLLNKYLKDVNPLMIAGGKKEIADFLNVTNHQKNIIGKVSGNYNYGESNQLADETWLQVKSHQKNQTTELLVGLKELIGKSILAVGIQEAWDATEEGNGRVLIIEKDYETHAYISKNGTDLKLSKPLEIDNYHLVSAAVERLIQLVRENNGDVIFTENGELQDFSGLVLKLRYTSKSALDRLPGI